MYVCSKAFIFALIDSMHIGYLFSEFCMFVLVFLVELNRTYMFFSLTFNFKNKKVHSTKSHGDNYSHPSAPSKDKEWKGSGRVSLKVGLNNSDNQGTNNLSYIRFIFALKSRDHVT